MQTPFTTREDALAAYHDLAERAERVARESASGDLNTAAKANVIARAQVLATLANAAATAAAALPSASAVNVVDIDPAFFDRGRVRYTPAAAIEPR